MSTTVGGLSQNAMGMHHFLYSTLQCDFIEGQPPQAYLPLCQSHCNQIKCLKSYLIQKVRGYFYFCQAALNLITTHHGSSQYISK